MLTFKATRDWVEEVFTNKKQTIGRDFSLTVDHGDYIETIDGSALMEAEEIELVVGSTRVHLSSEGVSLQSPQVVFETANGVGKPLAAVGDRHTCSKTNANGSPHQGGPILTGAEQVTLSGKAAAVVGSEAACQQSGPAKINQGVSDLLINGQPVAVVSATTDHGSKISTGVSTVLSQPKLKKSVQSTTQSQAKRAIDPIVDVIFSTKERAFYFLTEQDQQQLINAEKPFKDAVSELKQAMEKGSVNEPVKHSQQKALEHARLQINQLLASLNQEGDQLAEFIKLGSGELKQGWGYVKQSVLSKLPLKAFLQPKKDTWHYASGFSQGLTQGSVVSFTNTDKWQQHAKTIKSKVSVEQAKQALLSEVSESTQHALLNFNTGEHQGAFNLFCQQLENSFQLKQHQKASWVELDVSEAAQWLRYNAQLSANAGYSINPLKLALNINANAHLDLINAGLHTVAYFPSEKGFQIKQQVEDNLVDLGYFQAELDMWLYGKAGASIIACGAVKAQVNVNFLHHSTSRDEQHSANLLHGFLTADAGVKAKVDAFAGVRGGCNLQGQLAWHSPESVKPVQNPNKSSVKLKQAKGTGEKQWRPLIDLAQGLEVDAGIGAGAMLQIAYVAHKFVINFQARLVYGVGAAGHLQAVVSVKNSLELVKFVYHQIKNCNFHFTGLFKDGLSFHTFINLLVVSIWEGEKIVDYVEYGLQYVGDWIARQWHNLFGYSDRIDKILTLANHILSGLEQAHYLIPEARGRLIYYLAQYYPLLDHWLDNPSNTPAKAIVLLLKQVQSTRDYLCVLRNIVPLEKNRLPNALAGEKKLIEYLTAQGGKVYELEALVQQDQHLLANEHDFSSRLGLMLQHPDHKVKALCEADMPNALLALYGSKHQLRARALRNQQANQMVYNQQQLKKVLKFAKKQHRKSSAAVKYL